LKITTDVKATAVKVFVKRVASDDGHPLWRAWLAHDPFHRRYGRSRDQAIHQIVESMLPPEVHVTIGKGPSRG
jgi:hypothetical protein